MRHTTPTTQWLLVKLQMCTNTRRGEARRTWDVIVMYGVTMYACTIRKRCWSAAALQITTIAHCARRLTSINLSSLLVT